MKNEISSQKIPFGNDRSLSRQSIDKSIGTRNGQPISLLTEIDVDDEIFTERMRVALGLTSNVEKILLADSKLDVEQKFVYLSAQQIKSYGEATGSSVRIARKSQELLDQLTRGEVFSKPNDTVSSIMQHFMALQLLLAAVRGNDSEFVALLTPMKEPGLDINEIAKTLQNAGNDSNKITKILENIEGISSESQDFSKLMETLRFNPEQLKRKLRDSQHLPQFDQSALAELQETIEDELRDFEQKNRSTIRAAQNSLGAAITSDNPEKFSQSYKELIQETFGFTQAFAKLITHYEISDLETIVPKMKQALADDLRSEQRSMDKVRLEFLLGEISHMHISSTFIEKVASLISGLHRIFPEHFPSANAH